MKTSDFENKVAAQAADCLDRLTSADRRPLLELLGCTTLKQLRGHRGAWSVHAPKEPPAGYEVLISKTLYDVLRSHMSTIGRSLPEGLSILDGLASNDRWKTLMASDDGPYYLTTLLLDATVEHPSVPMMKRLRDKITPGVVQLLNDWCVPVDSFKEIPPTDVLVRVLFGDAWCDIVLNSQASDHAERRSFIWQARPSFSPGLLPGHVAVEAIALPEMSPHEQ